jgi:hypothetical protein
MSISKFLMTRELDGKTPKCIIIYQICENSVCKIYENYDLACEIYNTEMMKPQNIVNKLVECNSKTYGTVVFKITSSIN